MKVRLYFFFEVLTRWNSTYLMLDTAAKLKKVFYRLYGDDPMYLMLFSEVDLKSKKKHIGPPSNVD